MGVFPIVAVAFWRICTQKKVLFPSKKRNKTESKNTVWFEPTNGYIFDSLTIFAEGMKTTEVVHCKINVSQLENWTKKEDNEFIV